MDTATFIKLIASFRPKNLIQRRRRDGPSA